MAAVQEVAGVVLGLGVNGLGVVRSLAAGGVPVIGVYFRDEEIGRYSRYCRPALRLPRPDTESDALVAALLELGRAHGRPVLLPTSDEAADFVSRRRDELEPHFRFVLPEPEVMRLVIEKSGTEELGRRGGVPIPPTKLLHTYEDVAEVCDTFRFPCILKPLDTFSVAMPGDAKNVIVQDAAELRAFCTEHPELLGQLLLQTIIRGGDGEIYICASYISKSGEALAFYTGRKLRQYLPDYGVTCLGESFENDEVKELTARLVEGIGFRGLSMAEWVRDRETGAYYFVELNARSYYHNQLFTDCGANLAMVTYRDATDQPPESFTQRYGMRWLDFQRDLGSASRKRAAGEITWWGWFTSALSARSFAVFALRDPKPFLVGTGRLLWLIAEKTAGRVFRKLVPRRRPAAAPEAERGRRPLGPGRSPAWTHGAEPARTDVSRPADGARADAADRA